MASFASVSQTELGRRRNQLRRQRRLKLVQGIWQTLAVSSLAGGLLWGLSQPIWLITKPEQVKVEGNQWLSDRAVMNALPLSYPQSVWGIQPQTLAQKLESTGPIAKAKVIRHLFPPSLTIEIEERLPVAIAQPGAQSTRPQGTQATGWIDAKGGWMSLESYTADKRSRTTSIGNTLSGDRLQHSMPTLKVIGRFEIYRNSWPQFYSVLSRSAVKVFEVDWQNPGNLILKTELGTVHLGPYSSRMAEQLTILDKMRQLPKQLDISQIAYIDLKNPASPMIHIPEQK
ncbi:cell division protein FtsQ [Oscillatoriales cyanobacterium USR001]|nr:cell division protein FtsQ [Oscillatoriales cyanobacterium USR001]